MIAIYARQSVDRADSISIDQQIEVCRYETRGECFRTYIDRGYSGKNTNRPQFAMMMNDITVGDINTVIVYKLDRISRSILDFSNMVGVFERYKVKFISATEKFDTSSPMGNAMLNICIVFAQLERETIQKRVADAYFSRSRRSFYMGGPVPYGFGKVPTVIDGVHTSMYEPISEEADVVRRIFEMYSQPDTSYGDIIDSMNSLGIKRRGKNWVRQRIREMIINPIYVKADLDVYEFFSEHGAEIVDPPQDYIGENGCYSYKNRDDKKKNITAIEGNTIVIAPHKGIVDSVVWLNCREKCMGGKQVIPSQKAKNSWLCGKIKCGECGYALTVKQYDNGRRRYLRCSGRYDSGICKGAGTIYADEAERLICGEIRKRLAEFGKLRCTKKAFPDVKRAELTKEIAEINKETGLLLEKLADSDTVLFRYINERVSALDDRKRYINERIDELDRENKVYADETDAHFTVWDELSFDDKRCVADVLICAVYATSERIIIQWRI